MKAVSLKLALFLLLALPGGLPAATPAFSPPVRIILDTDMSGDCDDAGALALLHALADRGECELLATVVNRKDRTGASAAATDAINTFYGRPKLPIGTDKRGPTALQRISTFARALRDEFPNDIGPDDRAPDALDVYREVLAAQSDGSVVICSVGALSNLAELWRHAPDLVRKKVRLLVVMGGQFPKSEQPETNIATHREAAQLVAAEWPGDIVWHGWEVGNALFTGAALKQVPGMNPVRRAYELKPFGKRPAIEGGQPSWDQGAALFAVRGAQPELWDVVAGGRVRVDGQGNTAWQAEPKGRHSYVKIQGDPKKLATVIEDLMIQPPKQSAAAVPPIRIVFDTDMHTDCDDAGALAVLHALADKGECEILATVVSVKDSWSAATVDAINTYHGRPNVPLGMVKGPGVLRKSSFTGRIATDFPHGVKSAEDVPDATEVYRDVWAAQPDASAVIVTVGYLTNLRDYWDLSPPGRMNLQPPRRRTSTSSSSVAVPATRIGLARPTSPYPPSPVIATMDWAPTNKIVRAARDGDNWPLTWADHDALYTTWGDGTGFEPKVEKKLSLGFARVTGAPEPWGPWTTAFFTEQWDVGPGEHGDFPAKWMSADGQTLHLVFSGDDSFTVRKATVTLTKSDPKLHPQPPSPLRPRWAGGDRTRPALRP